MKSLLIAALAVAAVPLAAAESDAWNIEESRAPTQLDLDFVATEGSWMSLDVSPDGEHIVFDLLGHVYEMPADGGEAVALTSGRSWNMFPRYSPDGTRLVITSDRGGSDDLWVMDRTTGEMTNVSNMPDGVTGGMWSADGRFLYGVAMHDGTQNTVYQFGMHGTHQVLVPAPSPTAQRPGAGFRPINHFRDDPARNVIWFEQVEAPVLLGGGAIKTYDKATGDITVKVHRPGGAVAPALSPDGRYLAYVHRNDQVSELVLRDLDSGTERVVLAEVERDRQDYFVYHHAAYPTFAWFTDGEAIAIWYGGKIHRVSVSDGRSSPIEFTAQVVRKLDPALRFRHDIPQDTARSRIHRWAQRTQRGVVYETLGDLWLKAAPDSAPRNLTQSGAHESSPLVGSDGDRLYYVGWTDRELGAVYSRRLNGGRAAKLTSIPAQYGSLALSPDGGTLAFVRGDDSIRRHTRIEMQTEFDLVLVPARGGEETRLTGISMAGAEFGTRPPWIGFSPDGATVYFTEFEGTDLALKRIPSGGGEERTLYTFPNSAAAALSPDEKWIVYEEYQRTWLTPFEFAGKAVKVSAADGAGVSKRIAAANDGLYARFSTDSSSIEWTRGARFLEKRIDDIWSAGGMAAEEDLAISFDVAAPGGTLALTNARVLAMDPDRSVLDGATVLIEGARITAVGDNVDVPPGAKVIDATGKTIMPGIVDVHAHYMGMMSPTHTIEQEIFTLNAALAHGVTTMYEVYGVIPKDAWLGDMLRAGRTTGPRLFSVGTPMYGARGFRPKTWRSFATWEDVLEQVRFNKAHGATALKDYITPNRRVRHQLTTAARQEGLNVAVEPGGEGQANLTRVIDGATGIAHGMGFTAVYQDYLEFFAAGELGITPTLIVTLDGPMGENWFHVRERLFENEKLNRFSTRAELLARLRRPQHVFEDDYYHPELAANLKKLHDAGVSMQLGAHGQLLGLDAHFEMELYSHGGFSNMEVLAIATIRGAWHQGLDHDLGSVEAGKLADLVILDADPLDDIRNTRAIDIVVKNGMVYSGEDASRVWPDPEAAEPFYFQR